MKIEYKFVDGTVTEIEVDGSLGEFMLELKNEGDRVERLINSYCTDGARAELLSELRELADGYKTLCDMYAEKAEGLPADSPQRRHWRAQYNKTEVLRRRMENNIRLISGGKKG